MARTKRAPLAERALAWLEGTRAMTDVPNRSERVIYLLGAVDALADLGVITREQAEVFIAPPPWATPTTGRPSGLEERWATDHRTGI